MTRLEQLANLLAEAADPATQQTAHENYYNALATELGLRRDKTSGRFVDEEGRAPNLQMMEARLGLPHHF